jgi:hypothetical protein
MVGSSFIEDTFLDVQALDTKNMFAYGQWSDLFDRRGQGVQVSSDGSSFTSRNWAQANGARYGLSSPSFFPSSSFSVLFQERGRVLRRVPRD